MIPSALEQLLENRAPYVVHFRESKSKKFPPGHWARTLCHSRKKKDDLLDNLELCWPFWGIFILDKSTLMGTLKRENPKPLRDNGMHSLTGMQMFPKDKITPHPVLKGFLQHAN